MLDRHRIFESLRPHAGEARAPILVIHSSLIHLGLPRANLKYEFLAALRALTRNGVTLAIPAFTFEFCSGGNFDAVASRPETGVLAEWLLELEGSIRSRQPIYSFALAGPRAEELAGAFGESTFGAGSIFEHFEAQDARLLMLGCDWRYCTQLHRYEEEARVPYRLYKDFSGTARFEAGREAQAVTSRMYVRDLGLAPAPENDFMPAIDLMRRRGAIRGSSLASGQVESAACGDLASACRQLLHQDPLCFLSNAAEVRKSLARRSNPAAPLRVALLGCSNGELLRKALAHTLASLVNERDVETYCVPFGQLDQEILGTASELYAFAPQITVFFDRVEDLVDAQPHAGSRSDRLEAHFRLIETYAGRTSSAILVNRFAATQPFAGAHVHQAAQTANTRLDELAASLTSVMAIDPLDAGAAGGSAQAYDPRLWLLGRFPYSQGYSDALARVWSAAILAQLGKGARLVVTDLDNTVWGGVVGEDGMAGLKIGGDYPGNAFAEYQQALKSLTARGIALGIASKNDEAAALEVFRDHPDMALRMDDFVTHRINWEPKWENIRAMAEELNLGLENVLFIDDNPAECDQVRRILPEVKVIALPDDPSLFAQTLLSSPYLGSARLTAEDGKRLTGYRSRRELENARGASANMEEFYASLALKLHIEPLGAGNLARAAQLVAKTNQFNTTSRRYSAAELQQLADSGKGAVFVIGSEDRYSARENIGVLIVRWDTPAPGVASIDNFLLSCRILGRGIETGVIEWLRTHAAAKGMTRLAGEIIETPRNVPARRIYADCGFEAEGDARHWRSSLDTAPAAGPPAWLTINEYA